MNAHQYEMNPDESRPCPPNRMSRRAKSSGGEWVRLLAACVAGLCGLASAAPTLKVSENHRYLVYEDGRPFFYLGDTAWELFHKLNREEAERYLQDRAKKQFTVIQAVALAELDGLHATNAYGHTPLRNDDPLQPEEAYFKHVDWIVARANQLGLFIGLLPTWGDKWNKAWGAGPVIFNPQKRARVWRVAGTSLQGRGCHLGFGRRPRHRE